MTRFTVTCNLTKKVLALITTETVAEAKGVMLRFFSHDLWPQGVKMQRAHRGFSLSSGNGRAKRTAGPVKNFAKFTLPGSRRQFRQSP